MARNHDHKEKKNEPSILPSWQKNFVVGIDDCVCVSGKSGRSLTVKQVKEAIEIKGSRAWINKRYEEGHRICFLTTRAERLRAPTEDWLKQHEFKYHTLIMNKPKAREYHYIDDRHVQATTFRGKFATLVRKEREIQVFS